MVLQITHEERTALQLLASGSGIDTLADHFRMNQREVEAQLAILFDRMGVRSQAEALAVAFRRGLLDAS